VSATGKGKTTLSAFDHALKQAGVFNYNLIALSSIIPTGAQVKKVTFYPAPTSECGYRLYVVKAEAHTTNPDVAIAAGIGWYLFKNKAGVFVEHEIEGLTAKTAQAALKEKIYASLSDLCTFRGVKFEQSKAKIVIAAAAPAPEPQCALALAVYKAEPW
jgi:arginine decarboxylase